MQAIVFDRRSADLLKLLWERGVFAPGAGDMMFICPPLCLNEAQMNEIMDIVESALETWN